MWALFVCYMCEPRFRRKLTAKLFVCNMREYRFRRKLTAKLFVCNRSELRFRRKLTAKLFVCYVCEPRFLNFRAIPVYAAIPSLADLLLLVPPRLRSPCRLLSLKHF